jgi:hypothetical protein
MIVDTAKINGFCTNISTLINLVQGAIVVVSALAGYLGGFLHHNSIAKKNARKDLESQ